MTTNGPSVGRSKRTPAKHELMSKIFGREIGAMTRPRFADVQGVHWVDLTAGDGAPSEPDRDWHKSCSPGILAHHARYARCHKRVVVDLYELRASTYESLLANLAERLPALGYVRTTESGWDAHAGRVIVRAHNGDSTALATLETPPSWAVQIVNDPNKVSDWAMHPALMGNASTGRWCCLAMSTMGCNVAGLKMLKQSERDRWYEFIVGQVRGLQPHHDLFIAAIERDAAQWAYLVTAPGVWRDAVAEESSAAFRKIGHTLRTAWLRSSPDRFREICDALFKTKKELGEVSE
mgnify:CR=1 FL=1